MTLRHSRASLPASLLGGAFLLVVVTLSGGLAFAQFGGGGNPLRCNFSAPMTPTLRGEGSTEQTGDIVLVCTGGVPPAAGAGLPQVNITVYYNSSVTSRLFPRTTVSDALLLIDEPGSGLIPSVPGFGPGAPQNLCATPLQGCAEFVSQAAGTNVATDTAQGTTATTPGRNVFQGVVNGNSVTFYGVPVLAPGDGASRVFRITNVRVNANPLSGGTASGGTPVQSSISISGATSLALETPNQLVGFVTNGLTASVSGPASLDQCNSQNKAPVTTLLFAETFGAAFKTRVMAQDNIAYAGQNGAPGTGFTAQNVPGAVYDSESGFVLPVGAGQTAGLTDFGTRLKAQFNNVPTGARLFVSVANVQNNGLPVSVPTVIGGSAANVGSTGFAQLTANETGAFGAVTSTSFAPGTSGSVPVAEITVVNGSATAVWEVIDTNPNAVESFRFAVYTTYAANSAQNLPSPGTTTVNLSYAPAPPSFGSATAWSASDTLPVPRFVADATAARSILTIASRACTIIAPTTTTLTAAGSNPYTLFATVTTPSLLTTGAPVGTVTFYDNGTALAGSTSLNSGGQATFIVSLPGTPHRFTAVFTPTNSQAFTASTSPDVSVFLAKAGTSMEIASSQYPSLPGQAVAFTAVVTSAGVTPTGIVQFADGQQSLGSGWLIGGRANVTATLATAGVHEIFATYSGDGGNSEASARFGQRVERVMDTLSLTLGDSGQPATLIATLAPQAPAGVAAATGTVQFLEGSAVIGTATLASRGATLALPTLPAGTHQIYAVYNGDATWYGVRSSAVAVTVSTFVTGTTLTSSATMIEVRLSAALTPPASGGSVQFLDTTANTALGIAQPLNGTASLSLTPSDAAKVAGHGIAAVYSGSAGFAGSTSATLVLPALRNAAGGTAPQFAPEELVSFYGTRLAESLDPAFAAAMPQSLGGLSVNIADITGAVLTAGISYVSPSQVNFLLPPGLARGPALVTVVHAGGVVAAIPISIARVAPGIFASQMVGSEGGAVYLVLYGTGIRNRTDSTAVTCMVNGMPVPVDYAGAQTTFPGLDQVNVLLPSGLRTGSLSASLMVDGQASNVVAVPLQ